MPQWKKFQEQRQAQVARVSTSTSTSENTSEASSQSPSSQTESQSSGVLPLPKRRGRPPGTKNRPKNEIGEVVQKVLKAPLEPTKRELPEDAKDLDAAIAPYKIYVRMPIKALSSGFELAGVSPLDKDEFEAGTQAAAMLAYEYSAKMSGWFALAMFALGVGAPRVIEFAEKRRQERVTTSKPPSISEIKPPALTLTGV